MKWTLAFALRFTYVTSDSTPIEARCCTLNMSITQAHVFCADKRYVCPLRGKAVVTAFRGPPSHFYCGILNTPCLYLHSLSSLVWEISYFVLASFPFPSAEIAPWSQTLSSESLVQGPGLLNRWLWMTFPVGAYREGWDLFGSRLVWTRNASLYQVHFWISTFSKDLIFNDPVGINHTYCSLYPPPPPAAIFCSGDNENPCIY